MDKNAAGGGASLAGGADASEEDAGDGYGEVGGWGDDDGVVAAEFEEGASESGGDFGANDAAHSG